MRKEHLSQQQTLVDSGPQTVQLPNHPRSYPYLTTPPPRLPYEPQRMSFSAFRQFSPILIPAIEGGAFFVLLVLVILGAPASFQSVLPPVALLPFFFIFAAIGIIIGTALYYAPNETVWAIATVFGMIIYAALTTWGIFGVGAALTLLLGLTAGTIAIVRLQMHTVLEHTAHVMVLFGKRSRSIGPGLHLRFPFERVWLIVDTTEQTANMTAAHVKTHDSAFVDIAISYTYAISTHYAHNSASILANWQERVMQIVQQTCRDIIIEFPLAELLDTHTDPLEIDLRDSIAQRLMGRVRQQVGKWGIILDEVHVLAIEPEVVVVKKVETRIMHSAANADVVSGLQPAIPAVHIGQHLSHAAIYPFPAAKKEDASNPEALAKAYEAVRDRRVKDPCTIRRIAAAFGKIARDPILSQHIPYNAEEAAKNLQELAQKYEDGYNA